MKTALVLSGGGAKGAFQAGALAELAEHGFDYEHIAGVSVGALNGVMVAANRVERMVHIWRNITKDQIYYKRSIVRLILQYGLYKIGISSPPKSIYSNKPLLNLLQKELIDIDFKIPLTIGRVNLVTGAYINEINPRSKNFASTVLASTVIPAIWKPVVINDGLYVDGGIRDITPIADVIPSQPDRIVVITNDPFSGVKRKESIRDIVDITERSLDIVLNEIFLEDLERCMQINLLVEQAARQQVTLFKKSGKSFKYYELLIIAPEEPLGSPLDFERERLNELMNMGRQAAKNMIQHQ